MTPAAHQAHPHAFHRTPLTSCSDTNEHCLVPAIGLSARDIKAKEHASLLTCGSFSDFLLILHATLVPYIGRPSLLCVSVPSGDAFWYLFTYKTLPVMFTEVLISFFNFLVSWLVGFLFLSGVIKKKDVEKILKNMKTSCRELLEFCIWKVETGRDPA